MSKKMNDKSNHIMKIIVVILVIVGLLSALMNVLTRNLEDETEKSEDGYGAGEYYVPKDETTVANVCLSGIVNYPSVTGESINHVEKFEEFTTLLKNYDLALYTLKPLVGSNVSESFVDATLSNGFNVVGLATNTSNDYGIDGITKSMNYWNTKKICTSGLNLSVEEQNEIRKTQVNDITISYLSFTEGLDEPFNENEAYSVNVYSNNSLELVKKAASESDVVIVSMYWNEALTNAVTDHQKQIATDLAKAGASIVVGTSEQVIQPVQWIDKTLVYYSLGSLLTEDPSVTNVIGAIGGVTITKTELINGNTTIELTNPKVGLVEQQEVSNGYGTKIIHEDDETKKDQIDQYRTIIQSLDDSIRFGGME